MDLVLLLEWEEVLVQCLQLELLHLVLSLLVSLFTPFRSIYLSSFMYYSNSSMSSWFFNSWSTCSHLYQWSMEVYLYVLIIYIYIISVKWEVVHNQVNLILLYNEYCRVSYHCLVRAWLIISLNQLIDRIIHA